MKIVLVVILVLVVGCFGMRTTDQRPSTRTRTRTRTIFERDEDDGLGQPDSSGEE
jgi:hypothetical protein